MPDDRDPLDMMHGNPTFEELQAVVIGATGNFRLSERGSLLMEKVGRRLRSRGLSSLEAYLALLKQGDEGTNELDSLIAELTVGETSFFRHPEHFDALRSHVVPECLRRNAHSRQLRIWSAGCANGAEPYSIAIVVHSVLGEAIADWNITIVGSDINRAFLADAEAGSYSAWTFRNVPSETMPAFFSRTEQSWSIREEYKSTVTFVNHNLVRGEIPSLHQNIFAFDIVFCRNVMIYFDSETNLALTERLGKVLVEDGHLFIAPADFHSHVHRFFASEKAGEAIILRKRSSDARNVGHAAAGLHVPPPTAKVAQRVNAEAAKAAPSRSAASRLGRRNGASRGRVSRPSRSAGPAGRTVGSLPRLPDIGAIIEFANRGDWENAAKHCREILRIDACNVAAHYYYGLVLHYTGAKAEAEQAWRRAVYLDRDFALAHYQLGLARKDAHDGLGSRRAFRNTIDALDGVPDDRPISPCDQITALDLRELANQQLELLARQ